MLTAKLYPRRVGNRLVPSPMVQTYLELAQRLALPLATLDDELREAAELEGLALLGK